jgi:hypothetical protein
MVMPPRLPRLGVPPTLELAPVLEVAPLSSPVELFPPPELAEQASNDANVTTPKMTEGFMSDLYKSPHTCLPPVGRVSAGWGARVRLTT